MSRVADKVVLVTGAGSGIGRASAKLLAAEGATVIVTDVNRAGGLETVQQIGGNARFEEQDTAKEADWQRIIDNIMVREGRLDSLIAVENQTEIVLEDASPELLERIRGLVAAEGGTTRLLEMGHPRTTLERLFLKATEDSSDVS